MKFVLPGVWIAGFTAATLVLFGTGAVITLDGAPPAARVKWLFLAVAVLGGLSWYWWGIRLKRVDIDDRWLYVSNYFREIRIPLGEIEEVSENRWVNIRPVTISFLRDTDFGSRVIFMPRARWWLFWRPHPVVRDLEEAAHRGLGVRG